MVDEQDDDDGILEFLEEKLQREVRGRGVSSLQPCCSRLLCACSEVSPICGVGILSIIYSV